jgi:Arc/MetJ-type ribon-helix-helix transcriptional regulator
MTAIHSVQKTIRLSPELWLFVEQTMQQGKFRNLNDFIRACIRAYVDETGEMLGSRRYFNNKLAERMERLEALILWNSLQGQVLAARGLFTVLDELAPEDAVADPPTPDEQLANALEMSRKLLPRFVAAQTPIVQEIIQQRRKK